MISGVRCECEPAAVRRFCENTPPVRSDAQLRHTERPSSVCLLPLPRPFFLLLPRLLLPLPPPPVFFPILFLSLFLKRSRPSTVGTMSTTTTKMTTICMTPVQRLNGVTKSQLVQKGAFKNKTSIDPGLTSRLKVQRVNLAESARLLTSFHFDKCVKPFFFFSK